eukprot:SAG31_NODE_103_length_25164_cov_12.124317_28_plen_43_part_00
MIIMSEFVKLIFSTLLLAREQTSIPKATRAYRAWPYIRLCQA